MTSNVAEPEQDGAVAHEPPGTSARTSSHLVRGRAAYRRRAWRQAFDELTAADLDRHLPAAVLEQLGLSAYLINRDDDAFDALKRAHARYLDGGAGVDAARCAFWLSLGLLNRGEPARAHGWVARGQRLLPERDGNCVERGYLLVPAVLVNIGAGGDLDAAYADAVVIAETGAQCDDLDLASFALHAQGRVRIRQGRIEEGLALLDEAMVAVVAGDLVSPLFTGLIYCQVIDACEEVFDVRRAEEWTAALRHWCDSQSQMATFSGICLVHRAALLQLHGAWPAAVDEARQACARSGPGEAIAGAARYREAEILRLRGAFADAEQAYRDASELGWQPQPGLALLRLAQGRTADAAAAVRRLLSETPDTARRARILPAYIEILLAAGDPAAAQSGTSELSTIATDYGCDAVSAMSSYAIGAVELAGHHASAALVPLRQACQAWQGVNAPYEVARVRTLLGLACRELGDDDTASWELTTARDTFRRLGAAPDVARVTALVDAGSAHSAGGLTSRELQVLRVVAEGKSNRAIATQLTLSERTVDRHVSNILMKLAVPSRTAAAAYAYTHQLI
jgi:DNA-binding CsgD family transcriptional regulator